MYRKQIHLCLAIALGMACVACAGDFKIASWEKSGTYDDWTTCEGWDNYGNTVLTPGITTGVTLGKGALKVENDLGWYWGIKVYVNPAQLQKNNVFKIDITRFAADWTLSGEPNWNALDLRIHGQDVSFRDLNDGNSWWSPSDGDSTITATWDYSAYKDLFPKYPSWVEFVIAFNNKGYANPSGRGTFYLDNARLSMTTGTSEMSIEKCIIKAGKTQYAELGPEDDDVSKMKDSFAISGTIQNFNNLEEIDNIIVNLISGDDEIIYTEEIDPFYDLDTVRRTFKYSYKIPRGEEGAITSFKIDFNKNIFSIRAKNIDLTGLTCPVTLELGIGDVTISATADETIVNGAKKKIPIRLMRMYADTLRITKAKAKAGKTDSFTVKGEIAAEAFDTTDLTDEEMVISWGDTQTFTIPAGSFVVKKGHVYKCSKVAIDDGAIASCKLDLDKCKFKIAIKKAYLDETSGAVDFGISFADFDESATLDLP